MKSTKQLTVEIKKLNAKLDQISLNSRFLVYSANPFKFAFFNFIGGIFHSLGVLVGTAIIATALVYIASKLNVQSIFSSFVDSILNQIELSPSLPPSFY